MSEYYRCGIIDLPLGYQGHHDDSTHDVLEVESHVRVCLLISETTCFGPNLIRLPDPSR
jgi:hypothetical protein